jgi:hypothetical protein
MHYLYIEKTCLIRRVLSTKRLVIYMVIALTVIYQIGIEKISSISTAKAGTRERAYEVNMKRDLLYLMMAYPGYITGVEAGKDGNVYAVLKSGKRIIYDDRKQKSFEQKLGNADLQDMMEQVYPIAGINKLQSINSDPGRIRAYALFKDIYGGSKAQAQANLISIKTGYTSLSFNKNNGAAQALQGVMKELMPLCQSNSKIRSCVYPPSGTFNYRTISGTNLLSPHSFGIAIDLAVDGRDYWKWASRKDGEKRLSSYPMEIVQAFEKNNFIWGGKWGHFDIMHYEYRPEIILKSRYHRENIDAGKPWYDGMPAENVKKYIAIIDNAV